VKFNDYFEFPRQLDMVPYTVQGLAKLEGLYCCRCLACFVDINTAFVPHFVVLLSNFLTVLLNLISLVRSEISR